MKDEDFISAMLRSRAIEADRGFDRLVARIDERLRANRVPSAHRRQPNAAVERALLTLTKYADTESALLGGDARLEITVRFSTLTLWECRRQALDPAHERWTKIAVARFRRYNRTQMWTLFWSDKYGCFHRYAAVGPARSIAPLIAAVKSDPTGIFWG